MCVYRAIYIMYIYNIYIFSWHRMLLRPAMKRILCLKAKKRAHYNVIPVPVMTRCPFTLLLCCLQYSHTMSPNNDMLNRGTIPPRVLVVLSSLPVSLNPTVRHIWTGRIQNGIFNDLQAFDVIMRFELVFG